MEEIYTFGGSEGGAAPGGGVTPDFMTDISPEGLHRKALAFQRYLEASRESIEPVRFRIP